MPQIYEAISIFDILKIGVGPSSSHTLGPWRAAQRFLKECLSHPKLNQIDRLEVDLYGSLAKTGPGHGTDVAIMMGLLQEDPVTCITNQIFKKIDRLKSDQLLKLTVLTSSSQHHSIVFDPTLHIHFQCETTLPFNPNGLRFRAFNQDCNLLDETYYSIGGGFVIQEHQRLSTQRDVRLPMPIGNAKDLLIHCRQTRCTIPEIVWQNELAWRTEEAIDQGLQEIWQTMKACIYRGCHTIGELPGGLKVQRRASEMAANLFVNLPDSKTAIQRLRDRAEEKRQIGKNSQSGAQDQTGGNSQIRFQLPIQSRLQTEAHDTKNTNTSSPLEIDALVSPSTIDAWLAEIRQQAISFPKVLKWITCFALAVNEENASFGRVVTAPTNGAAGVIPAVLMYYVCFCEGDNVGVRNFLLTAGEIGSIFKKGSTISAAMGGCQAEIGVSSSMAAAALTQCLGGTPEQVLMAAEIAMEHHLGMTCDPVGGLVQIPCIERNTMGAIKAITASNLALESHPDHAKVSLDDVIHTMWETAQDMDTKYKETSEGGLAIQIPVNVPEC